MKKHRFAKRCIAFCYQRNMLSVFVLALLLLAGNFLYAQQTMENISTKKITVEFSNEPLKKALERVELLSGFRMAYPSDLIAKAAPVTLSKEDRTVEATLRLVLQNTGIDFKQDGRSVVLFKAKAATADAQAQKPINVRGVVRDENNEPLPDAAIVLKGTRRNVLTAADGSFTINDVAPDATLVVSFISYKTLEYNVNGVNYVEITMDPDMKMLDEVMVTGYQTISKERATGSFNVVRSETIERSHSSNLSTALLGTVAGMQGKENADGTIDFTIRGVNSLYANNQPLVVVDGFPVANGFKDINPNDVENVTVLKDAAASSIWGARSGNGVIVVVTRKGKEGAGTTKIDFNAMVRISDKLDLSTVLTNASSKDQVAYEKLYYDKNLIFQPYNNTFSELGSSLSMVTELLYAYKFDPNPTTEDAMNKGLKRLSEINNRGQIKDLLLETPILQQYNFTISNATQRGKNYMSLMYENQLGNVIKNKTDRWRVNFNNQTSLFKWLDFNFAANLHYIKANTSGPTIKEISALSPYEMLLNDDGSYATELGVNREQLSKIPLGTLPYDDWNFNLLREIRGREYSGEDVNIRAIAGLTFKLIEGLSYSTSFMYEYNKNEEDKFNSDDAYYVRNMVNYNLIYNQTTQKVTNQLIPKGGILQPSDKKNQNYMWRNQLTFDRTFKSKHAVSAVAGMEISEYEMNNRIHPFVYGYNPLQNTSAQLPYGGYTSSALQFKNIIGTNISELPGYDFKDKTINPTITSFDYLDERFVSAYGNFAYTYDGKYSLTGSVRADASNMITDDPKYRWEPLWSVGGMWHAYKESFVHNATSQFLDRLTLRVTYGLNANVNKDTSPYTLLSVSTTPSTTTSTFTQSVAQMGNPTLRWEKTKTFNVGFDFALFKNVLFGSIDFYNKVGKDIIGNITLSSVVGAKEKKLNNAGTLNRGIEVELGVNTKITNEIDFSTKVTYAYNYNKITQLFYPSIYGYNMLEGGKDGNGFVEGYPINSMWAYNYLGMDNGVPYVAGPDGTKTSFNDVSLHNRGLGLQYLQYMGPIMDPHTLGWFGSFSGYGFNLSFLLTGKFGGNFRNPTFNYNMIGTGKNIANMFIEEVFNGSDKLPGFPLPNSGSAYLWDRYTPNLGTMVESSSFIKLKEITLEYNLPKKWMNAIGLGAVKMYGQVRDLGCLWVANSRGYDPEWLPGTFKPSMSYAFGVNINLK